MLCLGGSFADYGTAPIIALYFSSAGFRDLLLRVEGCWIYSVDVMQVVFFVVERHPVGTADKFGEVGRFLPSDIARIADVHFPFVAFLGGDEDHTVATFHTVDGG